MRGTTIKMEGMLVSYVELLGLKGYSSFNSRQGASGMMQPVNISNNGSLNVFCICRLQNRDCC